MTDWAMKTVVFLKFKVIMFELYRNLAYLQSKSSIYPPLFDYYPNFLQDLGCEVLVAETDSYYHDEINLVMRVTKTNSSIPSLPLETPCLSIEQ